MAEELERGRLPSPLQPLERRGERRGEGFGAPPLLCFSRKNFGTVPVKGRGRGLGLGPGLAAWRGPEERAAASSAARSRPSMGLETDGHEGRGQAGGGA